MKKVYNNPIVNVLAIDAEDIITTSGGLKTMAIGDGHENDGNMVAGMGDFDF